MDCFDDDCFLDMGSSRLLLDYALSDTEGETSRYPLTCSAGYSDRVSQRSPINKRRGIRNTGKISRFAVRCPNCTHRKPSPMALKTGEMETHIDVRSLDAHISREEYDKLPRHGLYIILDNLRSAFNVGAIFRLADTTRSAGLFCCGYTAHPPHIKLEKTSMSTTGFVPWRHFDTTVEAVQFLRDQGIAVYAAETAAGAVAYNRMAVPERVGVVFGNEALGVSQEVLAIVDGCVEIPVYGFKNSLNVGTSCSVIAHHIVEEMRKTYRY